MALTAVRPTAPRHPLGCDGGFSYTVDQREEATMTMEQRLDQPERRNRRLTA